jgi:RNA recognition motif-containing protein
MNLTKSIILFVAFTIIGGIVFSQLAVMSVVSFLVGSLGAAFIFLLTFRVSESASQTAQMSTTTLYVGNLPYKANESNVKTLFSRHGEVFAVRLMKDKRTGKRRGFGFVVMPENDAQNAINQLNEYSYMDRTLKVRIANDPKHPESENTQFD